MLTHTGVKPFCCEVCGTTFTQNSHLKQHICTHMGEKPFNCEFCEATFSQNSALKCHLLIHTGQKPFQCEICEAIFSQHSTLKQHLLKHTGEKHTALTKLKKTNKLCEYRMKCMYVIAIRESKIYVTCA